MGIQFDNPEYMTNLKSTGIPFVVELTKKSPFHLIASVQIARKIIIQ